MGAHRFYTPQPLPKSGTILLTEEESHHLLKVMRQKKGDTITLVDGKGALCQAKVQDPIKNLAALEILTHHEEKKEAPLLLLIPFLAPPKLNLIIEKGAEIGVDCFFLYPAALGDKQSLSPHEMERLQRLLIAAIKQSDRLFLPELILLPALNKWTPDLLLQFPKKNRLFGDPEAKTPLLNSLPSNPKEEGILLATGPESGFSPQEVQKLKQHHFLPVSLAKNTLRAETAPLVGAALLAYPLHFS